MNDTEVLGRISELVEEEHRLYEHSVAGQGLADADQARLRDVEVALDQCWDLLRQRRAKREFGSDPGDATARDESTVEHYRQ